MKNNFCIVNYINVFSKQCEPRMMNLYPTWNWLILWLLGNFLKIDWSVVCYSNAWKSDFFLYGMTVWVTKRMAFRPAAQAWIQPVCVRIMLVSPHRKGLKNQKKQTIQNRRLLGFLFIDNCLSLDSPISPLLAEADVNK